MPDRTKVSAVLIVRNEEKNLDAVLTTLKGWADEIVIVDDHSTDRTREIAARYTDKVFSRKMGLEGVQRNFAVAKASNDWVFCIDADERMTPEVQKEVADRLAANDGKTMAYWVPRKNYLGNLWLKHGGWYPAAHIKFYNRKHLKWKEIPQDVVHPGVELEPGYLGARLDNAIIHYNFRNIEDFIAKTNRHTTLEAIKWHLQGKNVSLGRALWKSFDRFFRRFVRAKGYKDGYFGFVAAVLSGFYQFASYTKWRELKENGTYLDLIPKEADRTSDEKTPVSG